MFGSQQIYLIFIFNLMQKKNHLRYFKLIYDHSQWKNIRPQILYMKDCKMSAQQIIQELQNFEKITQQHRKNSTISSSPLEILKKLYYKDLVQIYQKIAIFILQYEEQRILIPFFPAYKNKQFYSQTCKPQNMEIIFKKQEVILLMCMMACMLICNQNPYFCSQISETNFGQVFSQEEFFTHTIIKYLQMELSKQKNYNKPEGDIKYQKLTLKRVMENRLLSQILHNAPSKKMGQVYIAKDGQSIEDYTGCIKIDFANQYIGGGALRGGKLQEQIMFGNHPQMFISMLFCQQMLDRQAISFIGFKKYFKNSGYANTCQFEGQESFQYKYDQYNQAQQYISAIDATCFAFSDKQQFKQIAVNREILKAYTGFSSCQPSAVVTGNWGCGAFNGNIQLKFLIQWLACSLASKKIIYTPFNSRQIVYNEKLIQKIGQLDVNEAYKLILQGIKKYNNQEVPKNFYEVLLQI